MEKELNLPTCLFGGPPDRDDVIKLGESQIGFTNIFATPLFEGVTDIFPTMNFSVMELGTNKSIWEKKIQAERIKRDSAMPDTRTDKPPASPMNMSLASSVHTEDEDGKEPPMPPMPDKLVTEPQTPPTPSKMHRSNVDTSGERSRQNESGDYYTPKEEQSRRSSRASRKPSSVVLPHAFSPHSGSRRSSKDAALDQLEQLQLGQLSTFSRLENQSFPTSRRGSADASLTTIYVSSQGQTGTPSPTKPASPTKHGFRPGSQPQQAGARFSVPSSRSHATSNATANTTVPQSPSTQASSVTDADGPPTDTVEPPPVLSTENPFLRPNISPDLEWREKELAHHPSAPDILAVPDVGPGKTNMISRISSGASDDREAAANNGGLQDPHKEQRGLRESRSRSKLRGLRFWRKRWKSPGLEVEESP